VAAAATCLSLHLKILKKDRAGKVGKRVSLITSAIWAPSRERLKYGNKLCSETSCKFVSKVQAPRIDLSSNIPDLILAKMLLNFPAKI
jgi:hypothetical protein